MKTLFDKDIYARNRLGTSQMPPYSVFLQQLINNLSDEEYNLFGTEVHAFMQVLEHECWLYEPRGLLMGDIQIYENSILTYPNDTTSKIYQIPLFCEKDYCNFGKTKANAIIVLQDFKSFSFFCDTNAHEKLNSIVINAAGVPRYGVRRFVRRLSDDTKLPVFFLSDYDTWGYFSYSVILRGCLAPNMTRAFDAIPDCHYLGLTAQLAKRCVDMGCKKQQWKEKWRHRIHAIASYEQFASHEWQCEFERFLKHKYSVDLIDALGCIGIDWIKLRCDCPTTVPSSENEASNGKTDDN